MLGCVITGWLFLMAPEVDVYVERNDCDAIVEVVGGRLVVRQGDTVVRLPLPVGRGWSKFAYIEWRDYTYVDGKEYPTDTR